MSLLLPTIVPSSKGPSWWPICLLAKYIASVAGRRIMCMQTPQVSPASGQRTVPYRMLGLLDRKVG